MPLVRPFAALAGVAFLSACGPIFDSGPSHPDFVTVPCPQNLVGLNIVERPVEPEFGKDDLAVLASAYFQLDLRTKGLEEQALRRKSRHEDCVRRAKATQSDD